MEKGILLVICIALFALAAAGCSTPPYIEDQLRYAAEPDRITAQVHRQSMLFDACRELEGAKQLDGTLVVRFNVDWNGHTELPHIYETIGQPPSLDKCLTDAALKMKFDPMPPGLIAKVEYPVAFHAPERQPASEAKVPGSSQASPRHRRK